MTYAAAKAQAQAEANKYQMPLTLYFSPIERSEFEPEAESWAYAPAESVRLNILGRWRERSKDEVIQPA